MSAPEINAVSLFLLGLLGTGHCLGMCGPLVVALPGAYGVWTAHLIYHAGRLTTYALIGATLGAVGGFLVELGDHGGTSALQWTVRIQAAVSLVAAWGLFWLGLIRVGLLHEPPWLSALGPSKIPGYGLVLHQSLHGKNFYWLYVMGLLLGLLPCGLSYAAFAKALASQQAGAGAGLSFIFGLGTLPGLLALGTSLGTLWRRFQAQADLVSGLLMVGMALSLTADALSAVF